MSSSDNLGIMYVELIKKLTALRLERQNSQKTLMENTYSVYETSNTAHYSLLIQMNT